MCDSLYLLHNLFNMLLFTRGDVVFNEHFFDPQSLKALWDNFSDFTCLESLDCAPKFSIPFPESTLRLSSFFERLESPLDLLQHDDLRPLLIFILTHGLIVQSDIGLEVFNDACSTDDIRLIELKPSAYFRNALQPKVPHVTRNIPSLIDEMDTAGMYATFYIMTDIDG